MSTIGQIEKAVEAFFPGVDENIRDTNSLVTPF